jgi:hypothetical protein
VGGIHDRQVELTVGLLGGQSGTGRAVGRQPAAHQLQISVGARFGCGSRDNTL